MVPYSKFELLFFDLFDVNGTLSDANLDLDINFFHKKFSSFETTYFSPDGITSQFNKLWEEYIPVFYLNIRSMRKIFKIFKNFITF